MLDGSRSMLKSLLCDNGSLKQQGDDRTTKWRTSAARKFNSSRFHMKKERREREEGGLVGASTYIIKQTNTLT